MYDGDDVDLLYILAPHGWSRCVLYVGDRVYEFSISHVFMPDPIYDLIEATISLLQGTSEVEFAWWGEPGGCRWKIIKNKDQHHKIKVTVSEFSSCYGELITDEEILTEFEIKISHFSTLVYCQMKKIATLLKERSFEINRSDCFPYTEFRKLESFFSA